MKAEIKELLERMRSPHNSLVTQSFLLNEGANVIEKQAKAIRANALDKLQNQGQDCTRIYEQQKHIKKLETAMTEIRDLTNPAFHSFFRAKSKRERLTLIRNTVDEAMKGTGDEF